VGGKRQRLREKKKFRKVGARWGKHKVLLRGGRRNEATRRAFEGLLLEVQLVRQWIEEERRKVSIGGAGLIRGKEDRCFWLYHLFPNPT